MRKGVQGTDKYNYSSETILTVLDSKVARRNAADASFPLRCTFGVVQPHALQELVSVADLPKVIGIVAPVGYGKTVLMTSLYSRLNEEGGDACRWCSLDDRHKEAAQVVTLLEEAIYGHFERVHPTQALFSGGESLDLRVDRLIDATSDMDRPLIVFVDNINHCDDDGLRQVLNRLLFESNDALRLVISSSMALPLDITRAKLKGLIRLVTYGELSFSPIEVRQLLGERLAAEIGPQGIETVAKKTEGWPAAVRMVQIILEAAPNANVELERFSGSDEDIAAFLNREVLSSLPDDVQQFLLTIAPLRKFSPEMLSEALGYHDGEHYIGLLIRSNAFVIPLDRSGVWYRLHALFREYLLQAARYRISRDQRQRVLLQAAEWCTGAGQWSDAIEYALEVNALDTASAILEQTATNFVRDRGDMLQYILWVEALRSRRVLLGWESEYWYAWALVLRRRYADARREILRLSKRLLRADAGIPNEIAPNSLNRRLEITKTCLAIFSDNLAEAQRDASSWLSTPEEDDHPFDTTAANLTLSLCYSSSHRFMEAREAAHGAQIAAFQTHSPYADGWVIALNSLPSILEGSYSQILPELNVALERVRVSLGEHSGLFGTIALLAANCDVEMGRYEEAHKRLEYGVRTARIHGVVDIIACGLDAAIKLWKSEICEGQIHVGELRDIASSYSSRATSLFSCFLVRRLLRLGMIEEAHIEAARLGLDPDGAIAMPRTIATVARDREAYMAAAIDLRIHAGLEKSASVLIQEETQRARQEGRAGRLVELALAEMEIAIQKGSIGGANRHLTRAVTLAATRGMLRPFDDHVSAIAHLVEDTKPTAWGFALSQERLFFSKICQRLPISNPAIQDRVILPAADAQLTEPLTRRQRELLVLLDSGLSNQQIADRISVSLTTVKGHLQKLYSKFNVTSRSAALARARFLRII